MTPERVTGHVRLAAGLDLIGGAELRLVFYAVATVLGTALGVGLHRLLDALT